MSAAVLTGCVSVGAPVFAADLDLSQKAENTPTLDYLKDNNILIPQKGVYNSGNKTWAEADSIASPGSTYNVVAGSEEDYSFVWQTLDKDNNIVKQYYKINLKPEFVPAGEIDQYGSSANITWTEAAAPGTNTVEVKLPDNTVKYFQYTYSSNGADKALERINDTLASANVGEGVVFENLSLDQPLGGVIYNSKDSASVDIGSDFHGNSIVIDKSVDIGTTLNAEVEPIYDTKKEKYGYYVGGTIKRPNTSIESAVRGSGVYNDGSIGNITGDFVGNTVSINNEFNNTVKNTINVLGNLPESQDGLEGVGYFASSSTGFYNDGAWVKAYSTKGEGSLELGSSSKYTSPSGSVTLTGGMIRNAENAVIKDVTGDFVGNTFTINNSENVSVDTLVTNSTMSKYNFTSGLTLNNNVSTNVYGTVLNNDGSIGNITGDYIGNSLNINSSIDAYISATVEGTNGGRVVLDNSIYSFDSTIYGGVMHNASKAQIDKVTGNFIGNSISISSDVILDGLLTGGDEKNNRFEVTFKETRHNINGGVLSNLGSIKNGIDSDFVGNKITITGSTFSNANPEKITSDAGRNIANIKGGVLYNTGNIGGIKSDFLGNTINVTTGDIYGGIIYNSNKTGDIEANFIGNEINGDGSNDLYGGAIYNDRGTLGNVKGNFINNKFSGSNVSGGAIYNEQGTIGDINANFINNRTEISSTSNYGGAIYNVYGTLGNITGDFIGNTSAQGGAICNQGGTIGNITGDFIANDASYPSSVGSLDTSAGSAIYNTGRIGSINGNFIANANARAVENVKGSIENIQGYFIDNKFGGLLNTGSLNWVRGAFVGNRTRYNGGGINNTKSLPVVEADFYDNYAGINGGGINNSGTMTSIRGNFVNNSTNIYGGGLYNTGTVDLVKGNFLYNHVFDAQFGSGGAINNGSSANAGYIKEIEGDFIGNYIRIDQYHPYANYSQGGAIYNIAKSRIDKITGNFIDNNAYGISYADGGAIHNSVQSSIGEIHGDFLKNHVIVEDSSEFYSQGGAVQNLDSSVITLLDGNFVGNYTQGALASSGGAIMNSKSARIEQIKGDFIDNYSKAGATGNYSQGGAIYNSSDAVLVDIQGNFQGNHVFGTNTAGGGAIYNNDAVVEKIAGDFNKNYALAKTYAAGGAVSNYFGYMNEIDGSFVNNYAKAENGAAKGGAIFSLGTTTLVAQNGKTNLISGNYVEDRNGKRNEAIYVSTGLSYVAKEDPIQKVDGSGFGYYNKYTNYNPENVPKSVESAFNIIAKEDGTFVINDMINGDSKSGSLDAHVTTYYANWNGSQRVYVDINDNFLVRYVEEKKDSETKTFYSENNVAVQQTIDTYTIAYKDENDNILGREVRVVSSGRFDSLNWTKSTYYDADGNEITNPPFKTYDTISSGTLEYNLNFAGDMSGRIFLNNKVTGNANVSLTNTNLLLGRDDALSGNNLTLNSGYLSMINNSVGVSALNKMLVTGDTDFVGDVDLKNKVMDRFTAKEYGEHTGNINVVGMNLLTDSNQNETVTAVYFAQPGLKNNVTNSLPEIDDEGYNLPSETYQATVYSPIYKYKVHYDNINQYDGKGDGGYFVFTRGGGTPGGNPSDSFNPAVLTTPVNTVAASQAGMTEAFKYVFEHLDAFTQLPAVDRIAKVNANKYALVDKDSLYNGISTDFNSNRGSFNYDESNKAYWFRPYVTFEEMDLKNGPKVDMITYGSLVGYDGDFKAMKHGWHRIGTSYIGYNGAQIKYKGADTTTNGGLLGLTETYYKGNFWTALTMSAGASVGETRTMYGKEDYVTLLAGAASKTGYNFEFKEGKYIFQPIMYVSYTFANTFDYTNAAGVHIDTKPAHSIQLHPMIRGVANCKNGWQPYLQFGVVWNALNKSNITANGVRMPEMSMKPYVEYGAGVQRNWDDKYTAFGQAMVRNGGRNGVALTLGFRCALDRDQEKRQKQIFKEKDKIREKVNAPTSNVAVNPSGKTVIKQMSAAQRAALCNNRKPNANTTITAHNAVLKQL